MKPHEAVHGLEEQWAEPDGFLWRLRQGDFDQQQLQTFLELLWEIEVDDDSVFPRRFVSLLWYIPAFMEWQLDRVSEPGGDTSALRHGIGLVRNQIDRLLGVP